MEKYRYIPAQDLQNTAIEPLVTDESYMEMSDREIQDMEWNQQRELNRMRNIQGFTGYLPDGRYIHRGMGQRRG